MDWNQVVQKVSPYIVKIHTPTGSGTGFLFMYNDGQKFCGIATALHVVSDADTWQQSIRISHYDSGQSLMLKESNRVIFTNWETDSAVIFFAKPDFPFPEELIDLLPTTNQLNIGCEVGWLGFPAIEANTLCFFAGSVSAKRDSSYLIDGVAIHGVSGGPVLYVSATDGVQIVGIVSAYKANRTGGDTLPGLLYAQNVSHFHDTIQRIKSIDEAKEQKTIAAKSEDAF